MTTNVDRLIFRLGGVGKAILVVGIAVLTACAESSTAPTVDDPASPPPPPAVQPAVHVQPHQASIPEGAQQQFVASTGGGQATGVAWRASGGSISSSGLYTAGMVPGVFMVIGQVAGGAVADTAYVTVLGDSTTQALMQDQWSSYATDADVESAYSGSGNPRKIYGNMDWTKVNLVLDPIFGKALKLTFLQQNPFYDTTTWPSGRPGAVMRTLLKFPQPVDAIWVRGRYKFDYDPVKQPYGWVTKSPNDPSPYGGSYKVFFMHWESPYYERGSLVYTNTRRLDFEYYINGLTMTSESLVAGQNGQLNEMGAPEFTDHEWYEFVYMHRKTGASSSESGMWVRRLTTGAGTVQGVPSPWRWVRRSHTFSAPIPRAVSVEFGGNKNHGNEFDQWILWGPYEIVDGTLNANPFGVPMN